MVPVFYSGNMGTLTRHQHLLVIGHVWAHAPDSILSCNRLCIQITFEHYFKGLITDLKTTFSVILEAHVN